MEMPFRSVLEERCYRLLEEIGGKVADRARDVLLEEIAVDGLREPVEYLCEKWRDVFAPAMVILSCEAVGGEPDDATYDAALALSLMNLSFSLWDDILDKTRYKLFVPTVFGKFGEGVNLVIGGLASAKAFSILNNIRLDEEKRKLLSDLIWNYWRGTAQAEMRNLALRRKVDVRPEEKFRVIEMHSITTETLLRVGAVLGGGSRDEVDHLGNYGRCLGIILELRKDFNVSINLTLELADKIKRGSLPYTLLWAKNHSQKLRKYLLELRNTIKPKDIKEIVKFILETDITKEILNHIVKIANYAKLDVIKIRDSQSIKKLEYFLKTQIDIFAEELSLIEFM